MHARLSGNKSIRLSVPNEPLRAGPVGARLQVIDYDPTRRVYYEPVNLDSPPILMRGGLDPSESDPRFHQQMVYAVASKVMENFDLALGRRIRFKRRRPLRIFPHAIQDANAFFDPKPHALLFGYFRTDRKNYGANLPGQTVFTCLSHDIIAHETTHAIVNRLRRLYMEATNLDVPAFHEGFSDIVAIFQHFTFKEILRDTILRTQTDLRNPTPMIELAQQFGYATGGGRALRSAVDDPSANLYASTFEPHERGSVLVAAVFDAYFKTYQSRIKDLLRIASGGTGILPAGDMHPDLVNRIALEASSTAQSVLNMCIRAFEYLPPVDITFGDYLRAIVTADYELSPSDEKGLRANMIEAFRVRGIYPEAVASLSDDSLRWLEPEDDLEEFPINLLGDLIRAGAAEINRWASPDMFTTEEEDEDDGEEPYYMPRRARSQLVSQLESYAERNADKLHLDITDPSRPIALEGFHPQFRVAPHGQLLVELVVQYVQTDKTKLDGGVPFRGGTTVVVSADGKVKYVISKPINPSVLNQGPLREYASDRFDRQRQFVSTWDYFDPMHPWANQSYMNTRMARITNLSALHRGIH